MMDWSRLLICRRAVPSDHLDGDRTEFEQDLSRVVFSTPVRRLQDKTHVFPLEQHDAVRTRLTHSLEVSSVARDLSQAAVRRLGNSIPQECAAAISTIAATCALLHDVGNPPFGHAGERAIQDWFAAKLGNDSRFVGTLVGKNGGEYLPAAQDFLQFDGNAQMVRLVGRLQVLSDDNGLNLTFATLSAACKYVVSACDTMAEKHDRSKPGYFETERDLIERVQEETGTGVARNPITYLVEAADDIVNVCIDLEDGIRKRVFGFHEMIEDLERHGAGGLATALMNSAEAFVRKSGLGGLNIDVVYAQAFRTRLMAQLIPAVLNEFQNSYEAVMEGDYGHELVRQSEAAVLFNACKEVIKKRIFCSSEVLRLEIMGRKVIHDLLDLYWEGVSPAVREEKAFSTKLYSIISDNYRHAYEQDLTRTYSRLPAAAQQHYLRLRLVCDQVAGMTDAHAVRQHRALTNA